MAKLPNREKCRISERKLGGYLLALEHPDGGPKARFLSRFGFTQASPDTLRAALLQHAHTHDVADSRQTEFGTIFEIVGSLDTPDGRNPDLRVIWMIDTGADAPRLITLVPA